MQMYKKGEAMTKDVQAAYKRAEGVYGWTRSRAFCKFDDPATGQAATASIVAEWVTTLAMPGSPVFSTFGIQLWLRAT